MIPYTATKHLVNATKEQQTTENDLRIIAENSAIRNRKEVHKYQKEIDNYIDKSEELEEDVAARETINQLLGTLSNKMGIISGNNNNIWSQVNHSLKLTDA